MHNYQQIVIDPPWPQTQSNKLKVRPNQEGLFNYSTLSLNSIEDIINILTQEYADPRAHNCWLWTINKFLWEAEDIMKRAGYRRHARIIWDKKKGPAPAFTIRFSHEYLLWFYKPKLQPVSFLFQGCFRDVITAKSREHSRKPDESYALIKKLYPDSKCLDCFSREKRKGWDQWGDEPTYYER